MSSAYVLVAFAVCILLMILFISKWKIHPVTSILVATIILAISIGTPWDKIEGIINKGMADTLKSIAIVIVLMLMTYVVPQVATVFSGSKHALPMVTVTALEVTPAFEPSPP